MTKINRYAGNLKAFGVNASATKRTVFNRASLVSDDLTDNISTGFLTGWETNPIPPIEYTNGVLFTATQLSAYVHQMGVPEYHALQEYPVGGICNSNGSLFKSIIDGNIGYSIADRAAWLLVNSSTSTALFTDYGAVGDGVTDCTEAFNSFLADTGVTTLRVPTGTYVFNSAPDAITKTVNIAGENSTHSKFIVNYIEPIATAGFLKIYAGAESSSINDLFIDVTIGKTAGSLISVISTAVAVQNYLTFSNLTLRPRGVTSYGFYIDGSANTNFIEHLDISNCKVFVQAQNALYMRKVKVSTISGTFTSTQEKSIYFAGNSVADGCQNIHVDRTITDIVHFDWASNITYIGTFMQEFTITNCDSINMRGTDVTTFDVSASKLITISCAQIHTLTMTAVVESLTNCTYIHALVTDASVRNALWVAGIDTHAGTYTNSRIYSYT